jgi:hypothetical protein
MSCSGRGLRLDRDRTLFAQEATHKISVGMPVAQAKEFLKSNGFSKGTFPVRLTLAQIGKPPPKTLLFAKTQTAFPRFLDKHEWRVVITYRDDHVQDVQGFYLYRYWALD